MDQSIIPECFIDTNLVETLVPPQKQYNHQTGCGTVASVMKKKFSDRFAVGIIDKDKHQIDYLKEFVEVIKNDFLILHKHKTKHHYIIQICPATEKFIIANAELVGISITDFSLPSDFELFKKASKSVNSKNDLRFKQLFKSLIKHKAPYVLQLAEWVKYLKDKNYDADINMLKEL